MSTDYRFNWNPHGKTRVIIAHANQIVEQATDRGYRFTLRQVYYKLVKDNIIPNTPQAYKNLSVILDRARWNNFMDPNALEDLERPLYRSASWDDHDEFLESCMWGYRTDWWKNASTKVEIWTEKRAVTSIVSPIAREFGIPYLAMRGYGSFTALYRAYSRFIDESVDIIYVGDFDPSGKDMDRDIEERLWDMGSGGVDVVRVALTYEQVGEYNLIPQPTKLNDSRAKNWPYEGSWELEALDDLVLSQLVREAVEERLPDDWEERKKHDMDERNILRERVGVDTVEES